LIEDVLERYGNVEMTFHCLVKADGFSGDVVRIAPNELVFMTPQAAKGEPAVMHS
jgi:hypothetical protein